MGHTALGHCCLGLIHWHCTALVVEVGIGQGHSITCCQVRCPFREGHVYGANRGVRWAGGRSGAEVGPTSRWATQEGHVDPVHGQRRKVAKKNKQKIKKKVKEREEGEKEYILIEYKAKLITLLSKKI